eukprot:1378272-Rhodomonas_salina.1
MHSRVRRVRELDRADTLKQYGKTGRGTTARALQQEQYIGAGLYQAGEFVVQFLDELHVSVHA